MNRHERAAEVVREKFNLWNMALDLTFNLEVEKLVGPPPSLRGNAERFATMTARQIYDELRRGP